MTELDSSTRGLGECRAEERCSRLLSRIDSLLQREGFDAWSPLLNKYEPTAERVRSGSLQRILRTPFDGDLLDATTTTFEEDRVL